MVYKIYQITKITKGKIQNYIKFELNDDVEFSDRKQKFIYCSNEYPFKDYRIGEEIEVNLTDAKCISSRNYHQEIVRKTVFRSTLPIDDYSQPPKDDESTQPPNFIRGSIALSAYEVKSTYDFLYDGLEWLELYAEKSNPNWQQKKQLPKTITRSDIPYLDAKGIKGHFSTSLTGLRVITSNKPQFLLEKLQTEFFTWLDGSGHNANNCSFELAQSLVDFYNILIGKGEDFAKRRRKETDENIAKMTAEERKKNFYGIIAAYQEPLENEDKVFEAMKGQTYRDVNNKSKFSGNADRGKEVFGQIEKYFKEQQTIRENQKALQDYREWEQEETMEGVENSSSTSGVSNQIQPTNQPIRWEIVNNIKQHANEFRTERVGVSNDGQNYDVEFWIIHNSAERKSDRNGCLVFDPDKMFKVKDLNEAEKKAIGYKSEAGLQTISTTPKNDDKGIGKGGIIAIVSVIGAFAITGIVVAKKRLTKKIKKV